MNMFMRNSRAIPFVLFLSPALAHAGAPSSYSLMVTLPVIGTSTTLPSYLTGMFQLLIGISGILAVLMIVVCGIKMMGGGSVSAKEEAKTCIRNAIFGLVIAIGSWVLLNTINPQLVANTATLPVSTGSMAPPPVATAVLEPRPSEPGWHFQSREIAGASSLWNKFTYKDHGSKAKELCAQARQQQIDNGWAVLTECEEVRDTPMSGSETAARGSLAAGDVYINNRACPSSTNGKGCTNVAGLPDGSPTDAIPIIKALASVCCPNPASCTETTSILRSGNCNVTVTGGTEPGHSEAGTSSHRPGNNVFDLGRSQRLDEFIKARSAWKAASFQNFRYYYNGYWYTDEGDHWHACKNGTTMWYCNFLGRGGGPLYYCPSTAPASGPKTCSPMPMTCPQGDTRTACTP